MRSPGNPGAGLRLSSTGRSSAARHTRGQSRRIRTPGRTPAREIAESGRAGCWGEPIRIRRLPSPCKSGEPGCLFLVERQSTGGTDETAPHRDRLGDVIKQLVLPVRKQDRDDIPAGITRQECGGDTTANAPYGAIAVHFTGAWIHYAEEAL